MKRIEIYTTDYCPFCVKAKSLLNKKKICDMEWIIKLMYVVAAFAIYFIIHESILGDFSTIK